MQNWGGPLGCGGLLEHAVHIHLGMRISSKVPGGLHAHSASHTSPREFLLIGLVEITCSSSVASKGSVGLFAKQFLKGLGMTRSLRDAGTFCFLLGNGSTFNSGSGCDQAQSSLYRGWEYVGFRLQG